jgi:HK97 family phage prohead protease
MAILLPSEPDGATPSDWELRFQAEPELRADDDAARRIAGYAAAFSVRTKIRTYGGEFEEIIDPGAFAATLASRADVRMLVEHDPRSLLARTSAGNLVLTEDAKGLRFEASLPDTQLGRDTYEQIRVKNFAGMSFGFRPVKTRTEYDGQGRLRSVTLQSVELREITVTSLPAYPKTSVALRSLLTRPETGALDLRLRLAKLRGC